MINFFSVGVVILLCLGFKFFSLVERMLFSVEICLFSSLIMHNCWIVVSYIGSVDAPMYVCADENCTALGINYNYDSDINFMDVSTVMSGLLWQFLVRG